MMKSEMTELFFRDGRSPVGTEQPVARHVSAG
jgi:hypothetical protein